jgi:hypothetical protein
MNDITQLLETIKKDGIKAVDLSDKEVFDILEMISVVGDEFKSYVWRERV